MSQNLLLSCFVVSHLSQFVEYSVRPEGDPDELKKLVQRVVMETQRIQSEFEYHRKIRNTYFHLFNDVDLPQESYVKNWSFEKKGKDQE